MTVKKITIALISNDSEEFKRLIVPKYLIVLTLIFLISCGTYLGWLITDYQILKSEMPLLDKLQKENAQQRNEFAQMAKRIKQLTPRAKTIPADDHKSNGMQKLKQVKTGRTLAIHDSNQPKPILQPVEYHVGGGESLKEDGSPGRDVTPNVASVRGNAIPKKASGGADRASVGMAKPSVKSDRASVGSVKESGGADRASVGEERVSHRADRASVGMAKPSVKSDRASVGSVKESGGADRVSVGAERVAHRADRASVGMAKPSVKSDRASVGAEKVAHRADRVSVGAEKVAHRSDRTSVGEEKVSIVRLPIELPEERSIPAVQNTSTPEKTELYPYSLQIGSYRTLKRVDRAVLNFRRKGLYPYWVKVDLGENGVWYRIFVGHFTDKEEAKAFRQEYGMSGALIKKIAYANLIGIYTVEEQYEAEIINLEKNGFSPYIIKDDEGMFRLYVGAFFTMPGVEKQHHDLTGHGIQSEIVQR